MSSTTKTTYAELGLESRLFKAIAKMGFIHPTLIQRECIPVALQGRDVCAHARTGSGKTLAFAIPAIQTVLLSKAKDQTPGIRAIVIVPTSELCDQVRVVFTQLLHYCTDIITLLSLAGGDGHDVPMSAQAAQLRARPDIIIATPGRLADHLRANNIASLSALKVLVMDEADLILSYGHDDDVSVLLQHLPKLHQTMLMSATLSDDVNALKALVMHDPQIIKINEDTIDDPSKRLQQFYLRCRDNNEKFLLVFALLKLGSIRGKTLFFVNSVDRGYRLKLFLEQFAISSAILNAELPENSRLSIVNAFSRGAFDHLIATDESLEEDSLVVKGEAESDSSSSDDDDSEGDDAEEEEDDSEEIESEEGEQDDSDGSDSEDEEEDEDEEEEDSKSTTSESRAVSNFLSGGANADEEESEPEEDNQSKQAAKSKQRRNRGYGVARGIDFKHVSTVVNFDFPASVKSYVHRIGRTARGGAKGAALSLATADDEHLLFQCMQHQTPTDIENAESMIKPLEFRVVEVEGFRYRVDNAMRAVTNSNVKEARLRELKMEMLNSTKLKAHFEDNPRELDLLRHDKVLRPAAIQPALANVPSYLIPETPAAPDLTPHVFDESNVGHKRGYDSDDEVDRSYGGKRSKRKHNDPLRSMNYDMGVVKERYSKHDGCPRPSNLPPDSTAVGGSTAGRRAWKERHHKGKAGRRPKQGSALAIARINDAAKKKGGPRHQQK